MFLAKIISDLDRRQRGVWAERRAEWYYRRRGWRLAARNWIGGGGELDLVFFVGAPC